MQNEFLIFKSYFFNHIYVMNIYLKDALNNLIFMNFFNSKNIFFINITYSVN